MGKRGKKLLNVSKWQTVKCDVRNSLIRGVGKVFGIREQGGREQGAKGEGARGEGAGGGEVAKPRK